METLKTVFYPVDSDQLATQLWTLALAYWPVIPLLFPLFYVLRGVWETIAVGGGVAGRAVVVTGADADFGYAIAVKCARAGMSVFAGCRSETGKQRFAHVDESESLRGSIIPVDLDVTSDASVGAALQFVRKSLKDGGQELWALVNGAEECAWLGPDEWCAVDDYHALMDVNFYGMIRVTHAFLPLLKKSRGRLIALSNVSGRVACEGVAAYSASKFAVEAWMDAIRQELRVYGIKCSILEPGGFRAAFPTLEKFARRFDAIWQGLLPEVRDEYGIDYKEQYAQDFERVRDASSTNYDALVNNCFLAIRSRIPRQRYHCGWRAVLLYIPMSFFPTMDQDIAIRALLRFNRVPKALQKRAEAADVSETRKEL